MMWLGRIDFLLTPPPGYPDSEETRCDMRRMAVDSVLLNKLVERSGARELLEKNDSIIEFMVGKSDNLAPVEFDGIIEKLDAAALFDDSVYTPFLAELAASPEYGQRILSDVFIMDPFSSKPDPLPVSYRLMGQRFVIDSYIFSNVIYDRIINNGTKIWRLMPDPLDAMFVLGNGDALPLLSKELERYHYAPQFASLRYLVDAYDGAFWKESLYNA